MSDTMLAIGFGAIILAFLIVTAIEWTLKARQRRAALEAWQAARPAPRLHENCRSALLDDPTPLNAGVDISTFVGPDGQPYLTAASVKRLGEQASTTMANRRRVKVYHPTRDTRAGTNGTVYYGQRFSGAVFDHIELVDPPKDQADRQWIHEHLMTRASPECIVTDGRREWPAWELE